MQGLRHEAAEARCTDTGETALFAAVMAGSADLVRVLLASGASINHQDDCGETPLIGAASRRACTMSPHVMLLLMQISDADDNGQQATDGTDVLHACALRCTCNHQSRPDGFDGSYISASAHR